MGTKSYPLLRTYSEMVAAGWWKKKHFSSMEWHFNHTLENSPTLGVGQLILDSTLLVAFSKDEVVWVGKGRKSVRGWGGQERP